MRRREALSHDANHKLAKHCARSLRPHVPGVVWGDSPDVARITDGKPVVRLTADGSEWQHDKHELSRSVIAGVRRLTVKLEANTKRLVAWWPWRQKCDPQFWNAWLMRAKLGPFPDQNVEAWYAHLGTIPPSRIIEGLPIEGDATIERAA